MCFVSMLLLGNGQGAWGIRVSLTVICVSAFDDFWHFVVFAFSLFKLVFRVVAKVPNIPCNYVCSCYQIKLHPIRMLYT